ncbi:hypothetical protein CCR75_006299 [Bremia lactucae]|uniref:Uncharacterized protein n=1 Tax=Bremia lactucae TaxID=4779 RepID=A0A976FPD5_BRELC|nr:hypothetical protein CCR75_006299 [Bremia lactucae]
MSMRLSSSHIPPSRLANSNESLAFTLDHLENPIAIAGQVIELSASDELESGRWFSQQVQTEPIPWPGRTRSALYRYSPLIPPVALLLTMIWLLVQHSANDTRTLILPISAVLQWRVCLRESSVSSRYAHVTFSSCVCCTKDDHKVTKTATKRKLFSGSSDESVFSVSTWCLSDPINATTYEDNTDLRTLHCCGNVTNLVSSSSSLENDIFNDIFARLNFQTYVNQIDEVNGSKFWNISLASALGDTEEMSIAAFQPDSRNPNASLVTSHLILLITIVTRLNDSKFGTLFQTSGEFQQNIINEIVESGNVVTLLKVYWSVFADLWCNSSVSLSTVSLLDTHKEVTASISMNTKLLLTLFSFHDVDLTDLLANGTIRARVYVHNNSDVSYTDSTLAIFTPSLILYNCSRLLVLDLEDKKNKASIALNCSTGALNSANNSQSLDTSSGSNVDELNRRILAPQRRDEIALIVILSMIGTVLFASAITLICYYRRKHQHASEEERSQCMYQDNELENMHSIYLHSSSSPSNEERG